MSVKRSRSPSNAQDPTPTKGHRAEATSKTRVNVFLFRRDLRVVDNTALNHLAKQHPQTPILPAFFFNPMQIDAKQNPYFGAPCVQFMFESLKDLNVQLDQRLVLLYGSDEDCFKTLQKKFDIEHVSFNRDYTPFAQLRDAALDEWCKVNNVQVCSAVQDAHWDYSLLPLDGVKSGADKPYAMFTPFYNKIMAAHLHQVPTPMSEMDAASVKTLLFSAKLKSELDDVTADSLLASLPPNPDSPVQGGRANALWRLKHILPDMKQYETQRNFLSPQRTSMLSPFMKFGCVSVREVFAAASAIYGSKSCFVKELFWREFYAMLLFNNPSLCAGQLAPLSKKMKAEGNMPFQEKFAPFRWKWPETPQHWAAFQQGITGVPLVDAAVRCLNATGWCHNRNRMVLGSFATKVLFVDWRVCEQWFATKAVDYDVASNSGGWQWCSGQGADAMPYFRTFNPFQQAKKFDESCDFIKKWIPELKSVDKKVIIAWNEKGTAALAKSTGYPLPIIDVKEATKRVIAEYGKY
jgi:deoxyribodipyrimidine photo-lyase